MIPFPVHHGSVGRLNPHPSSFVPHTHRSTAFLVATSTPSNLQTRYTVKSLLAYPLLIEASARLRCPKPYETGENHGLAQTFPGHLVSFRCFRVHISSLPLRLCYSVCWSPLRVYSEQAELFRGPRSNPNPRAGTLLHRGSCTAVPQYPLRSMRSQLTRHFNEGAGAPELHAVQSLDVAASLTHKVLGYLACHSHSTAAPPHAPRRWDARRRLLIATSLSML